MERDTALRKTWVSPLTVAAAVTGLCFLVYFLTREHIWLSSGLGSLAFASFALWSSVHRDGRQDGQKTSISNGSEQDRQTLAAALLAAVSDPALLLNGDGVIQATNELARDYLGLEAGTDLHVVIRTPELALAFSRAITERATTVAEVRIGAPVERRLTARIVPITGADIFVGLFLVSFRDRTGEAQLDQMRSDFVANASHELRTPLASLKGFIETLQGAAKDDPVARSQFLDIMQQEASRMSRLIDDLLSLSRIEMRVHVPPRERVDLCLVVREVQELLAPTAERAGQLLTATVPDGVMLVRGEKDELVQVVQNLVQNAIKYGRKGGTVTAVLTSTNGQATLNVTDDGIGIAKEHIPRLTERFYRVSAKDSRERGGTGLGLAIVKHIVNRHRGHLDIASKLGNGTTVTVTLPTV